MNFWELDDDHNPRVIDIEDFVAAIVDRKTTVEARYRVARTQIDGDCWVSTVFLFAYPGPRPQFETMVFGDVADKMIRRYTTWDDALAGHQEVVDQVMAQRV